MEQLYRRDLANVHVKGYGFHWRGAAPAILQWLKEARIEEGLVVDLGCGGGEWLQRLAQCGYATCGVDVSREMIRIARGIYPSAHYIHGSMADVAIPECDVITSLGEPINYLNSLPRMRKTFRRAFRALRSGGLFIFDVRHPVTRATEPRHHQEEGATWFCYARIEECHRKGKLTRTITTFYQQPNGMFRRDDEIHRLQLASKEDTLTWLREIGFRVRRRTSYGAYQLGPRQSVFICRKP